MHTWNASRLPLLRQNRPIFVVSRDAICQNTLPATKEEREGDVDGS